MDKAIFMTDVVAALKHKTIKTLLPAVQVEALKLKNIMNEIIPKSRWYFYSATDLNMSMLDD
jgi:hypothetical protein